MRKSQISFLIIATAMIFSVFMNSPVSVIAEPEEAHALPAELVFCGVFPISQRPDAGPDRRDGFLLAIDEINAQTGGDRILPTGVSIKGIALDDENTAAGGTAAGQSCITQGAHIVIGSSGSSVSAAIATELTAQKIPQISYASSSPSLSNRTAYPYFMRNAASDAWQGVALADVVDAFGFTKGAIIHTDDSYGSGLPAVFKENWDGTVDTTQTYQPLATDVTAQVQALKDSVDNNGVEFILLNAIDEDAKTVLQEARDLGLTGGNITFVLTDGSTTTSTFAGSDDVKEAMQGAIGTTPASLTGEAYNDFLTLWNAETTCGDIDPCANERTGKVPNSYAPLAYDATYIAAMGFAGALAADAGFDATDGDDRVTTLLDALYEVTLDGAGGAVAFDSIGEVVGRYDLVTLVNEGWLTVGEWQNNLTLTDLKYLLYNWGGAGGGVPGFEVFGVLFGVVAIVIIQVIRKTRK
ncbi:MAG: ABC transporter substrate-binding protein [Candidatus Hodarchaeales archaeon]|jgi:ABC-type branched-subunit amino acid transport system substrate-binding protein